MSTCCQIGFYDSSEDLFSPTALIYKHSDGYPDSEGGILPDIVPFLKEFHKKRGLNDTEYAAAWTLHHLIDLYVKRLEELGYDKDDYLFLSFGICKIFHLDIAFYYAIMGTKLKVYKVSDLGQIQLDSFNLIQIIDLSDK